MLMSFAACLEAALKDAADTHKACCHDEPEWAPFYARFVAKRLTPMLCGIQCFVDTALAHRLAQAVAKADESLPVIANVKGTWDHTNVEDGGPSWFLGRE